MFTHTARRYLANMNPTDPVVPLYPLRRPTLQWTEFAAAHYFLLRFLDQYQALTSCHDRRIFVWVVTNEVLMDEYLMDEFEEDGFTAGDVRHVSTLSTQINIMTQSRGYRQFPRGSVV